MFLKTINWAHQGRYGQLGKSQIQFFVKHSVLGNNTFPLSVSWNLTLPFQEMGVRDLILSIINEEQNDNLSTGSF